MASCKYYVGVPPWVLRLELQRVPRSLLSAGSRELKVAPLL